MIQVNLDGASLSVEEGTTVYELIKKEGKDFWLPFEIPQLEFIHHPECPALKIVEVDGRIVPAKMLKGLTVKEGMKINTQSDLVKEKLTERLNWLKENDECYLIRELQEIVAVEGENAGFITLEERAKWEIEPWESLPSIRHNPKICIRCKGCIETCRDVQAVEALTFDEEKGIILADDVKCTRCGQCIHTCPMAKEAGLVTTFKKNFGCELCAYSKPIGALSEIPNLNEVVEALRDPEKFVVVEFAPALRVSIGEEFGLPYGTIAVGKLYAALRKIGFDRIWDTNFAADLTIMEEGTELVLRLVKAGVIDLKDLSLEVDEHALEQVNKALPQFTSCSPGWIKYLETFYPELIPYVSSAKSPQQMFGAIAKTFAAEKLGIDPRKMVVVSIMPCTAKKFESKREEMCDAFNYWKEKGKVSENEKFYDVDYVITTREAAKLFKMFGINLAELPDEGPDPLIGQYTGAATIFGRTGGVMEAALRTAYEIITGKTLPKLEFEDLATLEGIKVASINLNGKEIKVAVAHGLSNARKICEDVKNGGEFASYTFIEFMACPGGCIGGGGQPEPTNIETLQARLAALNKHDHELPIRKSHENPEIKQLYAEFLGHPMSHLAHNLLHTHYVDRTK
ncbi:hydrogenase, Fe-only [Thermodesulfatator indicus DSM 15286]|uniref:Hydrogenase, Fe-only n=1 Tax=Thermodesulfatator indicus (strain DSM 15286 / JCM 11887 / CIR29812) TaxID=667014 RepID=F8AB11_THEID|nr:[FeFe] hydrogenase, group A [Thermodesulfatator indicus]AEH44377.1 hydrogenase, Fe-only [Thermodesulfatator indicus DSM 15286]